MRLPLRLLGELVGEELSVDSAARYLERVGFPIQEVIKLLPKDPALCTAKVTSLVRESSKGVIVSVETANELHYAYSSVKVTPESVVGLALSKSHIAQRVLAEHHDVSAKVLSEKDLGLEGEEPLVLPEATPVGVALGDAIENTVFEVEITPNRGDLYSVYGLARELSPLLGKRFSPPEPPSLTMVPKGHNFKLSIEAPEDVSQYYGFVIEGVNVATSPFWLRWMLHALGARPVNNVVDVTNYVMLLTGQPLHAFDAAKIKGSHVRVRRSAAKERFTAIDHNEYKLSSNCLLIADEDHPLALAGVMGGLDSEVDESAVKLFLESAEFTPKAIRRSIDHTGLHSESSKRFAAGVDGAILRQAGLLFIDMLAKLSPRATFTGELAYGEPLDKGTVALDLAKLDFYAAKSIDRDAARRNLELISFEVEEVKDSFKAKVPSHRNDVAEDVDLVEEVFRLSGYDDLPSRFVLKSERFGRIHPLSHKIGLVRDFLSGMGLCEVYSMSLISSKERGVAEEMLEVTNPLSERMMVLRPSLLPGMLEVAAENIRFGNTNLALYEIGTVFLAGPTECIHLGILLSGQSEPLSWDKSPSEFDFFHLKGIIEMLVERFGIEDHVFEPFESLPFDSQEALRVRIGELLPIEFGKLSREYLERLDIAREVYFSELDLTALDALLTKGIDFEPLPRFGPVERDMALLVDADRSADSVLQFVRREAGPACINVDVFDSYVGDPLPPGKRNLGLRLRFLPGKRSLSKEELDGLMVKLARRVAAELDAVVRGREGDGN